ncbi:MAG: metal ABC transporter ATP-binding protein [Verrucomicrobiota bacterium]
MSDSEPIIELRNISVRRGRHRILSDISLSIQRGDFWGVVGPNGAGKSTLLKVLAGELRPEIGNVISHLHGITPAPERENSRKRFRAGNKIGFLLQQQNFRADIPFTVTDVISFGCLRPFLQRGRRQPRKDTANVRDALEALQIGQLQERLYRSLSGGEKQKVQLARVYAQQAQLILLDEPTAGLDLDWQERLTALVGEIHSRYNKTLVMVTHDVDRLPPSCNKVLLLKDGSVLASGHPDTIFTADQLSRLYDCRMEVVKREQRFHAFSRGLTG